MDEGQSQQDGEGRRLLDTDTDLVWYWCPSDRDADHNHPLGWADLESMQLRLGPVSDGDGMTTPQHELTHQDMLVSRRRSSGSVDSDDLRYSSPAQIMPPAQHPPDSLVAPMLWVQSVAAGQPLVVAGGMIPPLVHLHHPRPQGECLDPNDQPATLEPHLECRVRRVTADLQIEWTWRYLSSSSQL